MTDYLGSVDDYKDKFDASLYLTLAQDPDFFHDKPRRASAYRYRRANEAIQDYIVAEKLGGKSVLVVGSGPSVHELAYMVPSYRSFVMSDLVDQNLDEIRKWANNDPECYDWSPFFKYYANRVGLRDKWQTFEEQARKSLVDVVNCDLLLDDPLAPHSFKPFDAIVAPQCLGALHTYDNAVGAIRNLSEKYLKPGGFFFTIGVTGQPSYTSPGQTFKWKSFSKEDFEQMHRDAGLNVDKVCYCDDKLDGQGGDEHIRLAIISHRPILND